MFWYNIKLTIFVFNFVNGSSIIAANNTTYALPSNTLHFASPLNPFGGIGASGYGNYRGEWGFRTFSHERAVMEFDASDFDTARMPRRE